MCWQVKKLLRGDRYAAATARTAVDAALNAELTCVPEEVLDDALLVTSELITNAVHAGSGIVTLAMHLHSRALTIEVTDTAPGWPRLPDLDLDATCGRGLVLVTATSTDWGVQPVAGGKSVWATIELAADLTSAVRCDTDVRP